jgi:hypothetical protein
MTWDTILSHVPMRLKSNVASDAERVWQTEDKIVIFRSVFFKLSFVNSNATLPPSSAREV